MRSILICTLLGLGTLFSKQKLLARNGKPSTSIKMHIEGVNSNDTLTLFLWQDLIGQQTTSKFLPHLEMKTTCNKEGLFSFTIHNLNKPAYFTMSKECESFENPVFIFDKYLIEPGDHIRIDMKKVYPKRTDTTGPGNISGLNNLYKDYFLSFSGKGTAKFKCRYSFDTACAVLNYPYYLFEPKDGNFIENNHYKKSIETGIRILAKFQRKLSPMAFQILIADFIGKNRYEEYKLFGFRLFKAKSQGDSSTCKKLEAIYKAKLQYPELDLNNRALAISNYYPLYLITKKKLEGEINNNYVPKSIYYKLKRDYTGALRDKVLATFVLDRFNFSKDLLTELEDAIQTVRSPFCLEQLIALNATQAKGRPAYDFSLPDPEGKLIRLSSFKGKVVFMDFWFTGCGACLSYYKLYISKAEEYFKNNDSVVFISISIDRNKDMWLKSIKSGEFSTTQMPNVTNLYTGGLGGNCELIRYYKIISYPTPFLIDKDGKIFSSSKFDLRSGSEELIAQIEIALKAQQKGALIKGPF